MKITEDIKNQIEFLQRTYKVRVNQFNINGSKNELYKAILDDSIQEFSIVYDNETISNIDFHNTLYKELENVKKDYYILLSTPSFFEKSFHPLASLHHWVEAEMRENIIWGSNTKKIFTPEVYPIGHKWNSSEKNKKSILSVRKETYFRNQLFSKLQKDDVDVLRYIKYITNSNDETIEDRKKANEFPDFKHIQNEYKSTIFSFVVESENGGDYENFTSHISEKTLLAFASGNIPIILGSRHLLKDLKNLGFYTFNDEFGFGFGDEYANLSEEKIHRFVECIKNIKKMSFDDSIEFYNKNLDKIQSNYDLLLDVLYYKKYY